MIEQDLLFWIYLVNAVFLINHEVESAYWREWELFKMKGEITGFLIIHFPIWIILLYGLVSVYSYTFMGLIISVIVSAVGVGAFFIHAYFKRKGFTQFTLPISSYILWGIFLLSLVQLYFTVSIICS